jgi:signal transduction histidine kinase
VKKILAIEDEEAVRANIVRFLKLEDFDAIGADNGVKGLQLAKELIPDLIICDLMMPEMDGYTVLENLRQDRLTATIPVIFLTAKSAKEDFRQGMELGASDYLTKPFTRQELLKAINAQLAKQEAIEQKTEEKLDNLRHSITLSLPHELRTPLNGILGSAELLMLSADSMSAAEVSEMAELIHLSAQRLQDLIQKFLLYAEIEITSKDPKKIEMLRKSYTEFPVTSITELAKQKAKKADREADLFLDLKAATVNISDSSLNTIVEEIIDNAFKYSSEGTSVRVINTLEPNKFIIEISDRGRGMTAEQIDNLGAYMQFDRQLHAQEGSGLGLMIAKRLTELHGGILEVNSIVDLGTTVRIELPMNDE